MCVGCGGTCASGSTGRRRGPRYTRPAAGPDLRVVGTNNAPGIAPDSAVRQTNGLITYEDLYTGLGPDGKPALMVMPGTFGAYATKAGRA